MIADIVFDWNILTVIVVIWATCMLLIIGTNFTLEIYRNRPIESSPKMEYDVAAHKIEKPIVFDPDATLQLRVRKIEKPIVFYPDAILQLRARKIEKPAPVRRRHAKDR